MWLDSLLNLLFPKRCVSCGAFGSYFCPGCLSQIKFIETPLCPICERASISGAAHPRCQTKHSLDGLVSVCVYTGPMKAAIHRLKYRPWIVDLGELLAKVMVERGNFNFLGEVKKKWAITPVPLHPSRERERGFNQAEILGKLLAKKLDLEFCSDLLIRRKKTKPQADLKGKERQENIKNAFVINPKFQGAIRKLDNSQLIIVDDVWTTGATLRSCGQILKRAGAKKAWALTLAR